MEPIVNCITEILIFNNGCIDIQGYKLDKVLLFDLKMTYKLLYPSLIYLSLPTLPSLMLQIVIIVRCDYCNKDFSWKDDFTNHMMIPNLTIMMKSFSNVKNVKNVLFSLSFIQKTTQHRKKQSHPIYVIKLSLDVEIN